LAGCCSFFLYSLHNVFCNNSHYYSHLRDSTVSLLRGHTLHVTLGLYFGVAFSLALSYYIAILISSNRRERTCWSCGIHHGRSSLRLLCVLIHTTITHTHTHTILEWTFPPTLQSIQMQGGENAGILYQNLHNLLDHANKPANTNY
jgi:hypothetical protein